ncbi:hypothetical protein NP493_154g00000 [Ridgeia piscesae]|uniref:Uncharacterized protein n=1 Tax=Ridgeia piscesae TaxID=27915 RepID=A0AAD9UFQ6_RIDPI|nr:hypothetical protein NP493_154g00000 [Ridgeia piscesae]
MSRKASSNIAVRKIEKSVGPTSPPTLTFVIIPVCRASIIVVNFSGHPYFLSSCHSPVLPTASNVLLSRQIQCTVIGPAQCTFLVVVGDKISYPRCSGYLRSHIVLSLRCFHTLAVILPPPCTLPSFRPAIALAISSMVGISSTHVLVMRCGMLSRAS